MSRFEKMLREQLLYGIPTEKQMMLFKPNNIKSDQYGEYWKFSIHQEWGREKETKAVIKLHLDHLNKLEIKTKVVKGVLDTIYIYLIDYTAPDFVPLGGGNYLFQDDIVTNEHNLSKIKGEIKHIDYNGHYPALCGGTWVISVGKYRVELKYCLFSTGNYDWDGNCQYGKWEVNPPKFLEDRKSELEKLANEHISQGCCGGCS